MSEGWKKVSLGEIADLNWGDTKTTKAAYVPVGFTAFSASGPDGLLPYHDYDRTGIVLSAIGSECGKAWLARGKWSCIKNTIRFFSSSPEADTEFLYWATRSSDFWPKRGSGQPFISQGDARGCVVSLPPLPEQRAIAATLGALDDKIELNRRMNATLEAMARALFRDWFVDFGPTRAKLESRTPYLSPDLWSLFPDRLDAEGKTEGWEVGTLNDLAALNPESWTARNAPGRVAYVDLANTKWGSIDTVENYEWAEAPSRARRILRTGDTIVGTVRPGNGSFCYIGEDGLTGSTGFAVLRPKKPRDAAFVWCAATAAENIDRLAHLADGGAYPAVRPDAVAATEIVIPGADALEAFQDIVSAKLDLIAANRAESRTLAQTRDLLLPRLMSGELRVAEAERISQEVA